MNFKAELATRVRASISGRRRKLSRSPDFAATPISSHFRGRDRETETESRSIVDRPARAPSRFEEFWKAYPRTDGPNPPKPAEAKFNALVKSGLDPQMLIDEVKKFAAAETGRGNIGTLGCRASPELLPQYGLGTDGRKFQSRGLEPGRAEAAVSA